MSVYVDPLMEYGGSSTFPWRFSCHLMADTDTELHEFAKRIGLRREWHQPRPPHLISHYDLTRSRRIAAVRHGAIEVELGFKPLTKKPPNPAHGQWVLPRQHNNLKWGRRGRAD